jgi:cation diffusion facilitator family transporter
MIDAHPGESGFARLKPEDAARITRQAASASVAVALILILLKGWAWLQSGSVAMLASLADSSLDLAASLFTYFAVRYAATPPDREHRFGHGKAESFAGLFQAGLVAVSAIFIVVEALRRLVSPAPLRHGGDSIFVMLVSIALTAGLIYWQTRALRQTGSIATRGDRAHYAADLGANVAVLLGIAAAWLLNWVWVDALVGIGVAAWLGFGAYMIARDAADHLMDRELPDEDRARITALALSDDTIKGVHDLRTRASGPYIHIQFHADMEPSLTLETAHRVVVACEARIRAAYPGADVIIHPDPLGKAEAHGHEYFSEGRTASAE